MKYEKTHFTGERALFMSHDLEIVDCRFDDGESPLKESHDLQIEKTVFAWKYPLWYSHHFNVADSEMTVDARAGIWYSHDFCFKDCQIDAPKAFRKCFHLRLENVTIPVAQETLWWNHDIVLENVTVKEADYFAMFCSNLEIHNLDLVGKYTFDGCENLRLINGRLITKDCFWNSKHIYLENCYIEAEYFGWNSEDVTLVNCEVHSHQGFCYMKGIKLINCKLVETDLCFEYCEDIDAQIVSKVDSIKNPLSGIIRVKEVGEIIRDDASIDHSKTEIIVG